MKEGFFQPQRTQSSTEFTGKGVWGFGCMGVKNHIQYFSRLPRQRRGWTWNQGKGAPAISRRPASTTHFDLALRADLTILQAD